MTQHQEGLFNDNNTQFYHLEYRLKETVQLCLIKESIKKSLSFCPDGVHIIVAFNKETWRCLNPSVTPKELKNFDTIANKKGFSAPSTQADVYFWIQSRSTSDNFDCMLNIQNAMSKVAELTLDLAGFSYHDSRDLIGFIDGSANPKDQALLDAALIPKGEIAAGGSYVLTQKWQHNLTSFNQCSVHQQEQIVGRTKQDSIELEGDAMPIDSHVSRTDVNVDGIAQKIFRQSSPYGTATDHGLYFLAFSCELSRFQIQLERMFGITEDGIHDQLIEHSKAITSSYWFAPSQKDLADIF